MFNKLLERCLEEKEFSTLYHLSPKKLSSLVLKPRIPSPEQTVGEEDEVTPRVSLAPTIGNCLLALGGGFIEGTDNSFIETDEFYVYKMINTPKLFTPNRFQVSDVNKTNEVWALSPVNLRLVSKIKYSGDFTSNEDYSKYRVLEEY